MAIVYRDTKELRAETLGDLFLSVDWSSGQYPEKLAAAIRGYSSVFTAWDGEQLVGLISSMDDGVMTAYIHYLLVRPSHQGRGIGRALVARMREYYREYLRLVLVAYEESAAFYERCGFTVGEGKVPMFITSLST